ncbi:MAG: glycine hydroxymethyltransferase [Thermoanaerobaculia bacterium]
MYLLEKFLGSEFGRINAIIDAEQGMLADFVNLVASVSYPFPEVLQALANPLFVFPTEGTTGERYFPGAAAIDEVETYARELVSELFSLPPSYTSSIQPHSGTQANQIVFAAVLRSAEDVVLTLRPQDGGHVSHSIGPRGRANVVYYGLDAEGRIDYEELRRLTVQRRPRLIVAGGSSYPREVDFRAIGDAAAGVDALVLADISHSALFAMTGQHAPIFPYAQFATLNMQKTLRGPCGGLLIYDRMYANHVRDATFPRVQGGPVENALFAKAVCLAKLRSIDRAAYARQVVENARAMAATLAESFKVVSGGTDSHIVLLDLRTTTLSGLDAELVCESHRILANRNLVPGDLRPPTVASGLRLGSTAVTTLGYRAVDAAHLAEALAAVLAGRDVAWADETISALLIRFQAGLSTASAAIGSKAV